MLARTGERATDGVRLDHHSYLGSQLPRQLGLVEVEANDSQKAERLQRRIEVQDVRIVVVDELSVGSCAAARRAANGKKFRI